MARKKLLENKITQRLSRKKTLTVFLREDFADLGGYDQVGRVLKELAAKGKVIRIGYGLYAKAGTSKLSGQLIPQKPLPSLAEEALKRLGRETAPSSLEKEYNAGRTTQIPTGRMIAVKGRIRRKIGYNGAYITYERIPK
jgi:hypothetical protein